MPFKSLKQERWGHTAAGEKALGGKNKVKEWDQASKGKDLPDVVDVPAKPQMPMAKTPVIQKQGKHGFAMKGEHQTI